MCVGAGDKFQANHPFPSSANLKEHNLDEPDTLTSRGGLLPKERRGYGPAARLARSSQSWNRRAPGPNYRTRFCERLRVDAQELWAPPFQGVQSVESELASVPLAQNAPRCRQTGTVEVSAGVHRRDKLRRTTRNKRTHQLRRLRRGVATRKSEIHDPCTVRTDAGLQLVFPTGEYSSAVRWSNACLKMSNEPFRFESNSTALPSSVHADGSSSRSSRVRRRGFMRRVPLASSSPT